MTNSSSQHGPLIVSFSGIDGAGKSTQISRLCDALKQAGLRVELITFWDDVAALKPYREGVGHKVFKGDKGVGSPEAPIRRRDKNVQSPALTLVRMALYVLDAISLRSVVRKAIRNSRQTGAEVIIFDRYLYDELANLKLEGGLNRLYVQAMLRFVPKPNVAFVLDADPDAAFARKPEYPLEFLHSNRNAYLKLSRMAGMPVIPPSPIDQAHAEILGWVRRKNPLLADLPEARGLADQK
jgi:thymidylate kinase